MASYKYEKADKLYKVSVKKRRLKVKKWITLLVIPSILLTVFGIFCIISSVYSNKNEGLSYNEKGNIDYKVYLKENNYYEEKYLGKNMQYIANLINTINADFKYEIHSTENMNFKYKYKIIGTLNITDKTDNNKVLYTKDYVLLDEVEKSINDNSFIINEDVDIDYDKYNNYANAFRRDYALTANASLDLKMVIDVDGTNEKIEKDIKRNNNLKMSIPLSEQTIDIGMTASNINNKETLNYNHEIGVGNLILLISGIILLIIGSTGVVVSIIIYIKKDENNAYETALHKLLKNYDTYIVKAKNNFKETDEVVRVESFDELIDAQKMEQKPIVFYEVEPGNKSYFVLNGDKSTYRFTLTKAYQERLILEHKKGEF